MIIRSTACPPGARRARPLSLLVTVLAALALSLVPGSASAAGSVTPLADCYAQNSDGTYTIVFGYTNNTSKTVTLNRGSNNTFSPSSYNSALPTSFKTGTQHGVFKVTITQAELNAGPSWYLDGTRLSPATANPPVCSASQLPLLANGAAVVGLIVVAGLIGAAVVRRQRRAHGAGQAARG